MLAGTLHAQFDDVAHAQFSGTNRFPQFKHASERDKRGKSLFDDLALSFLDQLRQPDFLLAAQQRNRAYVLEVTDDRVWRSEQHIALDAPVQFLNLDIGLKDCIGGQTLGMEVRRNFDL